MKKKQKKQKIPKETLREKMANSLDASKEVILDAAKLTFVGNRELMVENYMSIAEYTENKIILIANRQQIEISGAGLEIRSMARELLYISGQISALNFKKEG